MARSGNGRILAGNGELQRALGLAQHDFDEALGEMLEGCRQYLLLVANEELEPELRAKAGASDVVQETFLCARRDFLDFRGSTDAELLAWLRQMLLNQLTTLRRKYVVSKKRCVVREVSLDGSWSESIKPQLTADTGSPSSHAIQREDAQVVQQALGRLPPRYRQVIELRHRDQLPFERVGLRLELSAPAARQLWVRAIKRLERELRALGCD